MDYYCADQELNFNLNTINGYGCSSRLDDDSSAYISFPPSTPNFLHHDFPPLHLLPDGSSPYALFGSHHFSPPEFALNPSISDLHAQTHPPPNHQDLYYYSILSLLEDESTHDSALFGNGSDPSQLAETLTPSFHMGMGSSSCKGNNSTGKTKGNRKLNNNNNGQPSKNLMAERRRRKRLNDRLTMLRSVVPKISKMDRTSILGDTIDYIKELLDRITTLQHQQHQHMHNPGSSNHQLMSLMSIFQEPKPNQLLLRNSPKFEVERRNLETRVEICCGGKPGLLLSTVTTLEALGLDIHHSVISCFNDFTLQASCSEEFKKRTVLDAEDIREALHRNAGYGAN